MNNYDNKGKFARTNRDAVRELNEKDTERKIAELSEKISSEGYAIEFGYIGKKTTYCLLTRGEEEIVGYTFVRNAKYLNEKVGHLKALQQAVSRKELLDEREKELSVSADNQ